MLARQLIGVTTTFLVCAASCTFPFDDYDPRLGPQDGSGGAGEGGSDASSGPGSGGSSSTGGDQGTGGDGGSMAATGGGGSVGECVGVADDTPCGLSTDTDCDSIDTCQSGVCRSNQADDGTTCDDCSGGFCDGCSGGVCQDCSVSARNLATVYAGESSADGLMFDLESSAHIEITGFSLNLQTGFSGVIEVYVNPGGHVGDEETPSAWSLAFQSNVTSAGADTATFMSLSTSTIEMAPNQTLGIYVTSVDSGQVQQLYKTEGGSAGDPAVSNADLEITYGQRLQYPFTLQSTVKLWNGQVHYDRCE